MERRPDKAHKYAAKRRNRKPVLLRKTGLGLDPQDSPK